MFKKTDRQSCSDKQKDRETERMFKKTKDESEAQHRQVLAQTQNLF